MLLTPNKFIQSSVLILPLVTASAIPIAGSWFAAGIMSSGVFLVFNLYFWIRIVDYLIRHVAHGASTNGLQFFIAMKLLVLTTCVFVGSFFFPVMSIIIGNSTIVLSVLIPSFYASYTGSYTSLSAGVSQ